MREKNAMEAVMKAFENLRWFIKTMMKRYSRHNVAATSAYMAYHWVLAFFPFLIFVISMITYTNLPTGVFMEYLAQIFPSALLPVIETTINQFVMHRSTALLSVGGLITLWSAGTAVNSLIRGIHIAYSSSYVKPFVRARLVAIIYTILLAMLLILMMVLLIFGNRVGGYLFRLLDMNKGIFMPIWNLVRWIMPFVSLVVVIYIIYRFVPRKYLKVRIVWPGVTFVSIGWYLFSLGFSIYVDNYSKYNQLYGSIGSVFVLLIWLYGSCMLLVLGAEINALMQEMKLTRIERRYYPKEQ